MATKLYQEDIDKTVDWGGDDKTNGLPVSGEKVQKFIKNTLQQKFGYLYYDKDKIEGFEEQTGTNQYLIFSDQVDYEKWLENPTDNAGLIQASFNAPAPATIVISGQSKQVNTVLLSAASSQKLSFDYLIKDSSDREQLSRMSIAISVNNNISGTTAVPTQLIPMGTDPSVPIHWEFEDLGEYLSEGTNTVSITLTALEYNVSTTIIFQYRVLNLILTSNFSDSNANYCYYRGISLDSNDFFGTTLTAQGTGAKYLRVFIDGKNIYGENNASQFIGAGTPQTYELYVSFTQDGNLKEWATPGKHNIQFYFFVLNESSEEIKSQTLYYDFVLTEQGMTRGSYILFSRELEQGALVEEGDNIVIETEQYESISIDYAVYDTFLQPGSAVGINLSLDKVENDENVAKTTANIASSSTTTFNWTFDTYGDMILTIGSQVTGGVGDEVQVEVNVAKSSVEISKVESGLILELSAMNRSNSEPEEARKTWEYVYHIPNTEYTQTTRAEFDNVLWNNQNGWIDNCLVLNNGATVKIPMNIFQQFASGLTFEIDFETSNVQDDDANIMTYGEVDSKGKLKGAGLSINACNAQIQSSQNVSLITNYKDGARQKIAFIFNGNNVAAETSESPYLMYLVVNGILDRAAQFTSTDSVGDTSEDYFVIGNLNGKATIKIHTIRIYRRALTLDECVDNYIADSGAIRKNYLKNDIYNTDKTAIDVDKILSGDINIPVMTIYGDVTSSIVKVFNKKSNVPVDILYKDPADPQFNFFAHDCWISNQGTSSMNYPRRNFRLYMNKNADNKTLRGWAENDRYLYRTRVYPGLIDETIISQIQLGQIDDLSIVDGIQARCNKKWQEDDGTINKKKYDYCYPVDTKTAKRMWHSGIDLFTKSETLIDADDPTQGIKVEYKKIKNLTSTINSGKQIYSYGAWARFKEKDLFTDRWTLKCDYAESSMTHNSGVGRLWGEVMRNVEVGTAQGFSYDVDGNKYVTPTPCRTNAQQAAINYKNRTGEEYGDIRTSCDGKPIIVFCRPRLKGEDGQYNGKFGDPIYLGLYNIMTDKGSTPLFGFEDLRDDDGSTLFDASKCECWECLQNGSELAQMNNIKTDDTDGSEVGYSSDGSDNEDRPLFKSYEARWPDNDDLNDTLTNNLETLIRFVNACQDAVKVSVGGKDGYTLSDFTQITQDQAEELSELVDTPERATEVIENLTNWNGLLYVGVPSTSYKDGTAKFYKTDSTGEVLYDSNDMPIILDPTNETDLAAIQKLINKNGIYYYQDYASQNVTGSSFTALYSAEESMNVKVQRIIARLTSGTPYIFTASEDDSQIEYVEQVYDANLGYDWYIFDNTYDRTDVSKVINTTPLKDDIYTGKVYTFDGKRIDSDGNQVNPNAWVTVYLTRNGNNYTYRDEFGQDGAQFVGGQSGEGFTIETCSGNVGTAGESFRGKTLMDYWKDKKYEHFDIWKLAAYYVYIMRFAAVDQVIKNTMLTTEDGQHYYYINYDNDTVLGVRNDGYLAYDWKIDRNSYDYSVGSYSYAGFGSVLWNLLEQDDDFMNKVQTVATAMVTSGVLTYDIALDMFNNQQAGTWGERLYNNSELYKYIGTYKDIDAIGTDAYSPYQNTKYLPFLQGSRASHRDWWLRHRFDLYDSMWSAGEYATNALEFYMGLTASASNPKRFLRVVAGSKFYYTIQSNNVTLGNNFVELEGDQEYYFTTTETLILGNPMKMLGTYKIKVLDFSEYRDSVGSSMNFNWDASKGSMMTQLIIGGSKTLQEQNPCQIQTISNINNLVALEVLDIRCCNNLTATPDISNLGNLKKFLASNSNISSFLPAKGLTLEEVSLPDTIQNIKLDEVKLTGNFDYKPNSNLRHFSFLDCEGIDIINFLNEWYKSLIIDGARRTLFSCDLSFVEIELPQYIGPEDAEIAEDITDWKQSLSTSNPKKVESLAWLNEIRTGLGNNTSGEANFHITKGIIKLYGHGENGGLTEEDYAELVSIWPEEFFNASNAAHFDANKSVFITVTSPGNHLSWNEASQMYDIVSGQTLVVQATIFPASNERVITFIPRYLNTAGRWAQWNTGSNNSYYYNYGVATGRCTLINENGKGTLNLAEFTNGTEKIAKIYVNDNLASDVENQENVIDINIIDIVKPELLRVYNSSGNDITGYDQTVNKGDEEIIYEIKYSNESQVNVDVKSINAYFNDTNISENDFGTLRGWQDEETKKLYIGYTPIINSDTTNFRITPTIILADAYSTKITTAIPINLETKKIVGIRIEKDGEECEKLETGEYNIVNYITNLSSTQEVQFTYDIVINPSDFNVKIKNMEFDLSGAMTSNIRVVEGTKDVITGAIPTFSISAYRLSRKQSFKDLGDIIIKITDEFDNVIEQTVSFEVGCFYPDAIKLLKIEKDELGEDVITTDEQVNVDMLNGESKTVNFEVHVYSIINSQYWVWGEEGDIVSGEDRFLVEHPNLSLIDVTLSNKDNEMPFNEVMTANNVSRNKFELRSVAGDDYTTRYVIASYPVTFNGVTKNIDNNEFYVSRSSALAVDGMWRNLPVGGYFMDKDRKFYNEQGLADIANQYETLEEAIVCIAYVYLDNNATKQVVSLDPWKIKDNKKYVWYRQTSSFYNVPTNLYVGTVSMMNEDGGSWPGGNSSEVYEWINQNPMKTFRKMYDYYRFICSFSNGSINQNGGNFWLTNTNNVTERGLLARQVANGITLINGQCNDEELIFHIYDYYRNKYGGNFEGRPLTSKEYSVIMNNLDDIKALLNSLDGSGQLASKLFDETVYYTDSSEGRNPLMSTGMITDADNTDLAKLYFYNTFAWTTEHVFDSIRVYHDNDDSINSLKCISSENTAEFRMYATYPCYCLFGPQL